ncbi:DUF1642 domain-containing protein [Enterococcus faecalis]|uniref:DUF1642 domain-containing protein n=1 Tax=Enterococcus faecalis TaxID=1351 RepID=UPI00313CE1ED
MNKQELIEELECLEVPTNSLDYLKGADYANERAISLAKQLDEPIKVVVPKFVAEWLDKHKYSTDIIDLFLSVEYATDSDGFISEKWDYSGEFYDWLNNSADVQFTLCDAMRYGYEVEKEQLYYVKFDILYLQKYLVKNVETNQFYLSNNEKVVGNYEQVKFTEQEIKSIDERYWPFAVKVEDE